MKIKNKWGPLVLMSAAMFIIVIDTTIMNVSISALVVDLNTTISGIQTAISIYGLVMAAFILTGAKMADIIGKKRAFTLGLILFGIGTFTASISQSLGMLIIGWSIVEGLGSALMLPNTQTILRDEYEGKELAFAYGIIGAVGAVGAALGPIIGGFLTTYLTWRLAFLFEVLVVVFVLLMIGTIKTDILAKIKPKFDYVGTLLSAFGLGTIVIGILYGQEYGWIIGKKPFMLGTLEISPFGLSITALLIAIGVILVLLLFSWERHLEEKGTPGLFKPTLFEIKPLKIGLNIRFINLMITAGFMFVFPLFLQLTFGLSAINTGIALMPFSIALLILAILGAKISNRFTAKRIIQFGLLGSIIGLELMALTIDNSTTMAGMLPGTILLGAGLGLIASQIVNLELSSVEKEDVAQASGLDGTYQQLGNSIGVALLGSLLIGALILGMQTGIDSSEALTAEQKQELNSSIETNAELYPDEQVYNALIDYGLSQEDASEITGTYSQARLEAFGAGMAFLAFLGILGLIASIPLPNFKLVND